VVGGGAARRRIDSAAESSDHEPREPAQPHVYPLTKPMGERAAGGFPAAGDSAWADAAARRATAAANAITFGFIYFFIPLAICFRQAAVFLKTSFGSISQTPLS